MLSTDLIKKLTKFGPYTVILYLLCGGANMPLMEDIDYAASNYVAEQVEVKSNTGMIEGWRNKYLANKKPESNLLGKAKFTGPSLPRDQHIPAQDGITRLISKLFQLPAAFGGTNYGY